MSLGRFHSEASSVQSVDLNQSDCTATPGGTDFCVALKGGRGLEMRRRDTEEKFKRKYLKGNVNYDASGCLLARKSDYLSSQTNASSETPFKIGISGREIGVTSTKLSFIFNMDAPQSILTTFTCTA